MPIVHMYVPGEERGVIIPVDEAGSAANLGDYFVEAGGEFSAFGQPESSTDITPAYWDPQDSRFVLEMKRTREAAKVHIQMQKGVTAQLYEPYLGNTGTMTTVHIPAYTDVLAIARFHRLRKRVRNDLYDVGGAILYLTAPEVSRLAEVMPMTNRHA